MSRFLRLASFTLLLLSSAFAGAAEPAYFSVAVGDLDISEGKLADDTELTGYSWSRMSTSLPYIVLDGEGEAFWYATSDSGFGGGFRLNEDRAQRGVIAVRLPHGSRGVSGRFFYPKRDFNSYDVVKFKIGADKATAEKRKDFLTAKLDHYQKLQSRNIPGAAWFRHEGREASIELNGKASTNSPIPTASRGLFQPGDDFDDTYSLFSGNRAISENLQLDRVLPAARAGDAADGGVVALSSIEGVTVKEIDWKPLLKDKQPALDPLATNVPADQHVIFFAGFESMMLLADEADRQGTPLLQAAEPQSQQVNVLERYQRQIGLGRTALGRMLGPQVIRSVAITGSDAYFRIGTDFAIVFEPQDGGALKLALLGQITSNTAAEKGLTKAGGEYGGVSYTAWQTPDRVVSSYLADLGKAAVVTNSLAQLKRLIDVQQGKTPAIASLDEYRFFRDRYKLGEGNETAFLFLSDATIRRWCGPRWRIGDSRRVRDLGVLAELQAANLPKLAAGKVEPSLISTDLQFSSSGEVRLTTDGVTSSTLGSLEFMTPIIELPLERVTKAEATAYERWRDGYQRNFSWAFDPIALRFTVDAGKLAADLTVMPLIDNTEYREAIALSRGAKLKDDSADPHGAAVQVAFALNKEAAVVKQYAGMASIFVPQLKVDLLSWIGSWISIYADDSPIWEEIAKLKTEKEMQEFVRGRGYDLPVALSVEVSSAFKATAFLVGIRAFIEQTGPGMTIWENKQVGEDSYVKISPSPKAIPRDQPESKIAIYYALTAESLTISPNEKLIQDVLARKGVRDAKPEGAAKPQAKGDPKASAASATWLGENLCLEMTNLALQVFAGLSAREYQNNLQRLAWDNLPILNEMHRLYPQQDPIELHERLWGVRLTCPGGGKYVWNDTWQTMESTLYGHPGEPKLGSGAPPQLSDFSRVRFGLTFEEQGLRARGELTRKKK
ncbi:MAG: hypothetical protein K8U03_17410 [Planctomycetia bacterium]|nr:hypothetical protein [Planctomycetia bacterium]